MPFHHTVNCHGDCAGFLGNHRHHSVAVFADADGCPVTHSQFMAQVRVVGQREHAACRRNPSVPDNHRTVMERRRLKENIPQQFTGHSCINDGTGVHVLAQVGIPLKHHQRAGFGLGHCVHRQNRLGNGYIRIQRRRRGRKQSRNLTAAQPFQNPAQFRLEDNHHGNQAKLQRFPNQVVHHGQFQCAGQPQHQYKEQNALGKPGRVGFPHQLHAFINDERHQKNVQNIGKPDGF